MIRAAATTRLGDSGLEELPAPLKAITTIGMIVLASCCRALPFLYSTGNTASFPMRKHCTFYVHQ